MSAFARISLALPNLLFRPWRVWEEAHLFVWRRVFPRDPEAKRIAEWVTGKLEREQLTDIFPNIEKESISLMNVYQRTPGTSVDVTELSALLALVKASRAKRVLEIGTFDGNTALNLAANLPEGGRVVTVDLPPEWDGKLDLSIADVHQNVTERKSVGWQFAGQPQAEKITQIFGDSAKAPWKNHPEGQQLFDLVFIDGCHAYDYVKRDTENALASLKEGGILVWHDYGQIPDVSRAVDEFADQLSIHALRGTRLAVGKKGK